MTRSMVVPRGGLPPYLAIRDVDNRAARSGEVLCLGAKQTPRRFCTLVRGEMHISSRWLDPAVSGVEAGGGGGYAEVSSFWVGWFGCAGPMQAGKSLIHPFMYGGGGMAGASEGFRR